MPLPAINPPLINSANPWATTFQDLRDLYNCPFTGAITIRTSLLKPFPHNDNVHQYTFFSPVTGTSSSRVPNSGCGEILESGQEVSSLNTLGYSPFTLDEYLKLLESAAGGIFGKWKTRTEKPVIVSVTGTESEVAECYELITKCQKENEGCLALWMEVNLSCPNIVDKPPPAYDGDALESYLIAISDAKRKVGDAVLVGIKTPPYTYKGQYQTLIKAVSDVSVLKGKCPISFITACNTLGSCLVIKEGENMSPALRNGAKDGIGGMAGSALHPIALGNVFTIRKMLDASTDESVKNISIIGIGGVSDNAGYLRMRKVGADVVGVATALGIEGVPVFEKIIGKQHVQMQGDAQIQAFN